MAHDKLNIIIPMAGYGTRLRPHTWSKPKPLVCTAGNAVIGHVLDLVNTVFEPEETEVACIIGYYGEQVMEYMQSHYPKTKTHYYFQREMLGQSHAIAMARQQLHGPTLIMFVDTIIDSDLSFLRREKTDAVIWVKEVEDPRSFGVVELDDDGLVKNLIEKPDTMENNLAVVGYYYFSQGEQLMAAIDRQIQEKITTKGEYYLANAISLMLDDGLQMRPQVVDVWLDTGLPETILSTNRYLLENGLASHPPQEKMKNVQITPPVFIHPLAEVSDSHIGPHASVGRSCKVTGSHIEDSVLEPKAEVHNAHLVNSIIGARACIDGLKGSFNIGDDSHVKGI